MAEVSSSSPKKFGKFNFADKISADEFKEFEERYERFSEIPTISDGFIANNALKTVHIIKSQKNIRHKQKRTFLESFVESNGSYHRVGWNFNVSSTAIFPSPSGKKMAILNKICVNEKDKTNKKKQSVIEIYDNAQMKVIETVYPPPCSFGDIRTSAPFHGLSWNKSENLIAFIAEKQSPKSTDFFKTETAIKFVQNESSDDQKEKEKNEKYVGSSYEFSETFGEQMDGAKNATLFIFDLEQRTLYEPLSDNDILCDSVISECCFEPKQDSNKIILISLSTLPRRFGLRFYNTRPSKMWLVTLDFKGMKVESLTDLAPNDHSPQNVSFNPSGNKLIFLSTNNGMSHLSAVRLRCIEWENKKNKKNEKMIKTVIDIPTDVRSNDVLKNGKFGGLYCFGGHIKRCWIDDNFLILNALRGHVWDALMINVSDGTMSQMQKIKQILDYFDSEEHKIENEICRDLSVLDVDCANGDILFMTSSIQRGQNCVIYNVKSKKVNALTQTIVNNKMIHRISNKVILHQINDETAFESILYLPPPSIKITHFLLYVHGGPHSVSTCGFSSILCNLLFCGYAILSVNYRGSIGVCEHFTNALHGNIGSMDVTDCITAYRQVIETEFANKSFFKLVMGGSHGGFLTGHLIGQYPHFFDCASSRNPVLNLLAMHSLTDIPDWILCESGICAKYPIPNEVLLLNDIKIIEKINAKSPHVHLSKVETPYQILCGLKDERVPMQQAIEYYKALRAKNGNQRTRLLVYPDCQHSLNDTIDQELDAWANVWAWFTYHTKK